MDIAFCRPDGEFGCRDGNNSRDGFSAIEYQNGTPIANGVKVFAEMGLEIGDAYGSHD